MIKEKNQEVIFNELISTLEFDQKKVDTNQADWINKIIDEIKNEEENKIKINEVNNIVTHFTSYIEKNDKGILDDIITTFGGCSMLMGWVISLILYSVSIISKHYAVLYFFGSVVFGLCFSWFVYQVYDKNKKKERKKIDNELLIKNGFISSVAYGYLQHHTDDPIVNHEIFKTLLKNFKDSRLDTRLEKFNTFKTNIDDISKVIIEKHNEEKKIKDINSFLKKQELKMSQ